MTKREILADVVKEFPRSAGKVITSRWIEGTLLLEIQPPEKNAVPYWATIGEDGDKQPHETEAGAIAYARSRRRTA